MPTSPHFHHAFQMPAYLKQSKARARQLRRNMTDAERRLWHYLRRDQLHGTRFYRQRPLGNFILDFYAPSISLAIEVDGGQHFEERTRAYDEFRTACLMKAGIEVIRFDNLEVLTRTEAVVDVIERCVRERLAPR